MTTNTFFPQTLPEKTARVMDLILEKKPSFLNNFYLSGGTGLSLQLGHRESEDLDFFSQADFDQLFVEKEIVKLGALKSVEILPGTLNAFLNDVKLQFLHYPYSLLENPVFYSGMNLSSVLDIACTKLQTIGSRGSKKDFVDLFFILEKYSLPELLDFSQKKYANQNYSQVHILKSLTYFANAEEQPLPRMLREVSWEGVKEKIVVEARKVSL